MTINSKRLALVVGINDYSPSIGALKGCINDATNIESMVSEHHDGNPNFACKVLTSDHCEVTKEKLIKHITELLSKEVDIALLYFSGHGAKNDIDGFLVTQDATKFDIGVSLSEIMAIANSSTKAKEVLIMLDCCHSGYFGNTSAIDGNVALLRSGISILTASKHDEYAMESNGQGLFTKTIIDGLNGGAADILGNVTAASLYNYVDKVLGYWDQRPVFKSHITEMTSLRVHKSKVSRKNLRKIIQYFPNKEHEFLLDPSYEFTVEPRNEDNESVFGILQKFTAAGLVSPNGNDHMYFAAIQSLSCSLTPLGQFYWSLVKNKKV